MRVQHVAQRPGMGVFAKARMRTVCNTHSYPETTLGDYVGWVGGCIARTHWAGRCPQCSVSPLPTSWPGFSVALNLQPGAWSQLCFLGVNAVLGCEEEAGRGGYVFPDLLFPLGVALVGHGSVALGWEALGCRGHLSVLVRVGAFLEVAWRMRAPAPVH